MSQVKDRLLELQQVSKIPTNYQTQNNDLPFSTAETQQRCDNTSRTAGKYGIIKKLFHNYTVAMNNIYSHRYRMAANVKRGKNLKPPKTKRIDFWKG